MKTRHFLFSALATVLMAVACGQRVMAQTLKVHHANGATTVTNSPKTGDVNGDGAIDVADIAAVISVMAGGTDISLVKADVNGDGNVDVADISAVIDIMAGSINEPEVFVNTEGIGDWSEMRIASDGSYLLTKNAAGKNIPDSLVAILPSDDLGVLYSCATFDENGMPQFISINEVCIVVDDYYENYVDLTIYYNDTIVYSVDSLSLENLNSRKYAPRRSWSENNWQRNLVGVVELASGAAGVVGGALMVTGSVVSEVGSLGTSTPISIPGIVAGSVTIAGGVSTFESGWNKLFAPGEHRSDVEGTLIYEEVGELISNGTREAVPYIPEQYIWWMRDPNYANQLDRAGWINFLVGLSAGLFDNRFGRTVSWEDIKRSYQGQVITGIFKDVTTNSVVLRGYISPSITRSLKDGSKLQNEYGIILYSTVDGKERYTQKVTNGDGGMIEYSYTGLKPATTYNYVAYYVDNTNGLSLLGETKSFQTESLPVPIIEEFKVTKSTYEVGAFNNEGQSYDYKFDVSVMVSIEASGTIDDWGYVYCDPNGRTKEISLKSFGRTYTDTRYSYFRSGTPPFTCTLYGYVKYAGIDKPVYGEPQDYPLEMSYTSCPDSNHPHWIDLGIGTQWRCCNEGASRPEEYGGYYTFDQAQAYNPPSLDQIKALVNNCSYTWTTQNGVSGGKFTGPNGGTIFLPAAGCVRDGELLSVGSLGGFWSSSPYDEDIAYNLAFYSSDAGWRTYYYRSYRYYGLSVRSVR